jgi:hypothetical protein
MYHTACEPARWRHKINLKIYDAKFGREIKPYEANLAKINNSVDGSAYEILITFKATA